MNHSSLSFLSIKHRAARPYLASGITSNRIWELTFLDNSLVYPREQMHKVSKLKSLTLKKCVPQ